jgi:hypothetical protein
MRFLVMHASGRLEGDENRRKGHGEKDMRANLANTERNERQAFKRQQFSVAKSEVAYDNHFVLNSSGGNPKSAMSFPSCLSLQDR